MFSPHAKAVAAAGHVTERLLETAWQLRKEGDWAEPGNEHTPDDKLPMIRLKPPGARGGNDWFLELLGAPDENSEQGKTFHRVQTSTELIKGTTTKRSNKDLGRVLALAWLTAEQDRRNGTQEIDLWAGQMANALRERFPGRARQLAQGAGSGLRELMASDGDRDEAPSICNKGLLASMEVGRDAFEAMGRRVIQHVVEPLAEASLD